MGIDFELKKGFHRVVVNVAGQDKPFVIESGVHTVTDPELIAALDDNEGVKRAEADPEPSKAKKDG